jgi:hypothetical protein
MYPKSHRVSLPGQGGNMNDIIAVLRFLILLTLMVPVAWIVRTVFLWFVLPKSKERL